MKEEVTSLDISAVVRELKEVLVGSSIDNIYQLDEGSILLKLRRRKATLQLIADSLGRLSLTRAEYLKPKIPPRFCKLLRSRLRGGCIVDVEQVNDDRVVSITIERGSERFFLIVEMVRGFNAILLDEDGKIVDSLYRRRMKDRSLIPKELYKPPPPRGLNPLVCSFEEFKRGLLQAGGKVIGALVRNFNVAVEVAQEACFKVNVAKDARMEVLDEERMLKIHEALIDMYREVKEGVLKPNIVYLRGKLQTVLPIEFKSITGEVESLGSFNEALDLYFLKLREIKEEEQFKEARRLEEEQLRKVLSQQEAKLKELLEEGGAKRRIADLLMLKLNEVQNPLDELSRLISLGMKREGVLEKMKELGIIVDLDLASKKVKVLLDGHEVDLDYTVSAAQNASRLYEEAKEAERKAKSLEEVIKVSEEKFKEAIKKAEIKLKPTRVRAWYEKFRWFLSSDGLLVIGGRDASQNEVLVKKYVREEDFFFHADVYGAPVVIVKEAGQNLPEATIYEAAQFALSYSKAWKEGLLMGDAYWVKPDQVSKKPPSGEYLAKGSFIIRGRKNYVRGVPLSLAIGLDNEGRIVGGPPQAVAKKAERYAILTPGGVSGSKLAKELVEKLKLEASTIDEVQRWLPPGGGRISTLNLK